MLVDEPANLVEPLVHRDSAKIRIRHGRRSWTTRRWAKWRDSADERTTVAKVRTSTATSPLPPTVDSVLPPLNRYGAAIRRLLGRDDDLVADDAEDAIRLSVGERVGLLGSNERLEMRSRVDQRITHPDTRGFSDGAGACREDRRGALAGFARLIVVAFSRVRSRSRSATPAPSNSAPRAAATRSLGARSRPEYRSATFEHRARLRRDVAKLAGRSSCSLCETVTDSESLLQRRRRRMALAPADESAWSLSRTSPNARSESAKRAGHGVEGQAVLSLAHLIHPFIV